MSDLLVPIAIALIMLGIGVNLTFKSFTRVFVLPRAIITGLSLQMILLPVMGFVIAMIADLPPAYQVGIVLVSACPGGTASNLVTHMLRGRVALSISMTAFNSFMILFTIPAVVSLSMDAFMQTQQEISLSFGSTFQNILLTVILPVAIGIGLRHYFPGAIDRARPALRYVLPVLLLVVFAMGAIDSYGSSPSFQISGDKLLLTATLIILNLSTILAGYFLAGFAGVNHEGRFTIAIEMGLQNSALALFIASQIIQNDMITEAAVIYSSFSFFTTLGLAFLLKRQGFLKAIQ